MRTTNSRAQSTASRRSIYLALCLVLVGIVGSSASPAVAQDGMPLTRRDFIRASLQGFGDRQNSWAWSMQWWNGHLYVGTNRAWHCAEVASFNHILPNLYPYPPDDPDVQCTPDPKDLPLQAEIWRWTPATNSWARVYRSPADIRIGIGKFVAREVGYRGMNVFTEPDGTEALYVAGVSAQFLGYNVPPARILRSTDGIHFNSVPQAPGTVLGDLQWNGFRNQISYNKRFYIIAGAVQGSGALMEAANPAGGNNNFRVVSPPGVSASAVQSFNGFLYLGTHSFLDGYSVLKTRAEGTLPYTYTTVVTQGGYLPEPNSEILSMQEFNNHLYIGGNGLFGGNSAAELIRINPDDTWDVVVGDPRLTPSGWKFPISGLPAGFGNAFNGHMWRMEVFDGNLYVGTFDSSTTFKDDPVLGPTLEARMGFDLYRTPNGVDFIPVTATGFGDKFNFGARSLEATPYGLFVGTTNYYYGLEIWRAPRYSILLPIIQAPKVSASSPASSAVAAGQSAELPLLNPPDHVAAEIAGGTPVVSWGPVPGADQYRIVRSEIQLGPPSARPGIDRSLEDFRLPQRSSERAVRQVAERGRGALAQEPPREVGRTAGFYLVDRTAVPGKHYLYYVEAVDRAGQTSPTSNIALAPPFASPAAFSGIAAGLGEMRTQRYLSSAGEHDMAQALAMAQAHLEEADYAGAARLVASLRLRLEQPEQTLMTSWKAADLIVLLRQLEQRIRLVQAGVIRPADVK